MKVNLKDIPGDVVSWLHSYRGDFHFYKSLYKQLVDQEWLSERQIESINKAIIRDEEQEQIKENKNFTYQPGDLIQINAWLSRKFAAQIDSKVFFQKLIVTEVIEETRISVNTKVKFHSGVTTSCNICGLPLETEVSKACGIGPICAKRLGIPRPHGISAPLILMVVEAFAKKVGEIGPFWIPKSKIKEHIPHADIDTETKDIPKTTSKITHNS